ncbi:DUF6777 domain-containing protein [Streptomyces auratus]|uniref:DUF6777 domain-containing protein n=1 Tax=Streptomyces auratus AGR0001 TaxID=1160718 RepID=A0A8B1P5E6_9ACTN|nr:DUF6777 domain-containing protein [Streptomyces auratus]QTZ96550.1 hypothetical protein SU9_027940 [Streptomyces auratus AGR0001]
MTSSPPPDSHPTGPPSGPLSGHPHEPTQVAPQPGARPEEPYTPETAPRPGGPSGPGGPGGRGGGGGGGGGGAGGGRPWWRSAPRVAIIAAVVVAAVIITIVLTRPSGTTSEVFAEPAASTGPNPVTKSSANESTPTTSATPKQSSGSNSEFSGATPGLYGGTENSASCDVEKQISYLTGAPAKNKAFAGVVGVTPGDVPRYLRSLTPVQLAYDTRVTNHGYKDGKTTEFQSVLQAGTAVMVDAYGVPRVRCKCGNPLTEPKALQGNVKTVGTKWPGYRSSNVVVVKPAKSKIKEFTLRNPKTGTWFKRPQGTTGTSDSPTSPPSETPSGPSSSQPPPNESPSSGETSSGTTGSPGTSTGETTGQPPGTTGGSNTTGGTPSSTGGETGPGGGTTGGETPSEGVQGGGTGTPGSGGAPGGGGGTPPSS